MTHVGMTMPQSRRNAANIGGFEVKLEPQCARIVERLLLARPNSVSPDELIEALYDNPDDEPEWPWELIRHRVYTLRRLGVPIVLHRGPNPGYSLPDGDAVR